MPLSLCGYCRGCGQTLDDRATPAALCPHCRAGRAAQDLDRLLSRAGLDLLAGLDRDSVRRLRRLRRHVRQGQATS
ncbi:MAG: hypothetical protein IT340_06835 [Chloroflexi bacterium]|nr:hypothetical protein [Chloroflexota bacterium]